MITLLVYLVILGVVAWLIEVYLPVAQPFKMIIRVVLVFIAIYFLLQAFGLGPSLPRN
jgi:hypothetical protein